MSTIWQRGKEGDVPFFSSPASDFLQALGCVPATGAWAKKQGLRAWG